MSRRTGTTRPNGTNTSYSYDSLSQLLGVLHQTGASSIDGTNYVLDAAGNTTQKSDLRSGTTSTYTYDASNQLTQVTQAANSLENYTYDPVGNRLSSLTAATSSYNSSNQLTSNSNTTYAYDANGNTISKTDLNGTTAYAWDFENRMSSVTLPGTGGTVSFKYDSYGRRIYKASSSAVDIYSYDGDNLTETVDGTGNVLARYVQGQTIDEPLALQTAGTTTFYQADSLGSISSLSDSTGTIAETYTTDSFGEKITSSGSINNTVQYTGREFDVETGLYFYRARYYDPSIGRFINEDPIQFLGGINSYRYVSNRPANFRDPWGLCPPDDPCALPKHPWWVSVDLNIMETLELGPAFQFVMVLPNAPWDYKKSYGDAYDNLGNFNFGATGAALGYSEEELLFGAGALKTLERRVNHLPPLPYSPSGLTPYGNQNEKQQQIKRGIEYFRKGCWWLLRRPI